MLGITPRASSKGRPGIATPRYPTERKRSPISSVDSVDVGADRIARTAYAALTILGNLRVELGLPIPLAWAPADVSRVAAIEVYPAATLVAHRIRSTGYKKRDQTDERHEIIVALRTKLTIGESVPDLATSADLVDAAVCVLAGADFISGRAMGPEDRPLAEREGGSGPPAPHA